MGFCDIFSGLWGGHGKADFLRTERQGDGNTYDIYHAPSRTAALAFLRGHEINEERRYAIVETPQGNLGKDFIVIFEEQSQKTIELASRRPLARSKPRAGHCSCCGYPVIPYNRIAGFGDAVRSIETYTIVSQAKENGAGYYCESCGDICCAICAAPDNQPRCRSCNQQVLPYSE